MNHQKSGDPPISGHWPVIAARPISHPSGQAKIVSGEVRGDDQTQPLVSSRENLEQDCCYKIHDDGSGRFMVEATNGYLVSFSAFSSSTTLAQIATWFRTTLPTTAEQAPQLSLTCSSTINPGMYTEQGEAAEEDENENGPLSDGGHRSATSEYKLIDLKDLLSFDEEVRTYCHDTLYAWYNESFYAMYQAVCKRIAKIWIRAIHPKKQRDAPYNLKEGSKPEWWPNEVPHGGPDHLRDTDRVKLLISILTGLYRKKFSGGIEINAVFLKEAIYECKEEILCEKPNGKNAYDLLLKVLQVRRIEEKVISGDGHLGTFERVKLFASNRPRRGAVRRKKRSTQDYLSRKRHKTETEHYQPQHDQMSETIPKEMIRQKANPCIATNSQGSQFHQAPEMVPLPNNPALMQPMLPPSCSQFLTPPPSNYTGSPQVQPAFATIPGGDINYSNYTYSTTSPVISYGAGQLSVSAPMCANVRIGESIGSFTNSQTISALTALHQIDVLPMKKDGMGLDSPFEPTEHVPPPVFFADQHHVSTALSGMSLNSDVGNPPPAISTSVVWSDSF